MLTMRVWGGRKKERGQKGWVGGVGNGKHITMVVFFILKNQHFELVCKDWAGCNGVTEVRWWWLYNVDFKLETC